jgi:hypothetical protein
MNIRNIIKEALEKYPPVVTPSPCIGFFTGPASFTKSCIDARDAAQYASNIIFNEINHDLIKERAAHAAVAQELNDLKASLRLLVKE